jgi:hypothetical protein
MLKIFKETKVARIASQSPDMPPSGYVTWSNVNNILARDNTSATANVTSTTPNTVFLEARDFGFSLPPGAIVLSVSFTVRKRKTSMLNTVTDLQVYFINQGTWETGTNYAQSSNWNSFLSDVSYDVGRRSKETVEHPFTGLAFSGTLKTGTSDTLEVDVIEETVVYGVKGGNPVPGIKKFKNLRMGI